jgi:hypothetical protein
MQKPDTNYNISILHTNQMVTTPYESDNENEKASPQKFNLTEPMVKDLNDFSDLTGRSKTDLVKTAITRYFQQSPYWAASKFFLRKKNNQIDLSILDMPEELGENTRVNVMWCPREGSTREHFNYVGCAVVRVIGDNHIEITPQYYLPLPPQEALSDRSSRIIPNFEFDPEVYVPTFLNHFRYIIERKYIWEIY